MAAHHLPTRISIGGAARGVGVVAVLVSCAGGGLVAPSGSRSRSRDTTVVLESPSGLVQRLRLSENPVSTGDTLVIESVLLNHTAGPVRAWRGYTCRLDLLETTLRLVGPVCLPPTGPVILASGDSVRGAERQVVASPPGRYSLAVQQTVDTAFAAALDVTVREP